MNVQGITGLMLVNFARAVELELVMIQQRAWGHFTAFSIPYNSYQHHFGHGLGRGGHHKPAARHQIEAQKRGLFLSENC